MGVPNFFLVYDRDLYFYSRLPVKLALYIASRFLDRRFRIAARTDDISKEWHQSYISRSIPPKIKS